MQAGSVLPSLEAGERTPQTLGKLMAKQHKLGVETQLPKCRRASNLGRARCCVVEMVEMPSAKSASKSGSESRDDFRQLLVAYSSRDGATWGDVEL